MNIPIQRPTAVQKFVTVVLLEPGVELLGTFSTTARALAWCERHLDGEWEQMGEMDEDGILELWNPLTEQTVTLLRSEIQ